MPYEVFVNDLVILPVFERELINLTFGISHSKTAFDKTGIGAYVGIFREQRIEVIICHSECHTERQEGDLLSCFNIEIY